MATAPRDPQAGTLVSLLRQCGCNEELLRGMSPLLRARMVPSLDDDAAMAEAMLCGTPFLAPRSAARDVFEKVGDDGVQFVTDERWNRFPKPKLAMKGGWGGPGTPVIDADHVALVHSFSDCLDDPSATINLQMFHRSGSEALPSVARELHWPLGVDDPERELSVVLDEATRISAAGAVTWWHLDDGGEFTFQVGLPLKAGDGDTLGPEGRPVVKLFVFAPKEAYTLCFQDSVMNATGCFAVFDPFRTPSDALPAAALPEFWVAALEAGGRPLLSAPNLPHLVVTVRSCVMVEQRRVLIPFLDESVYFINRRRCWDTSPQLYTFIKDGMQRADVVRDSAVKPLLRLLARKENASRGEGERGQREGEGEPDVIAKASADAARAIARMRIAAIASLEAIVEYPEHFAADAPTLQRVRAALELETKIVDATRSSLDDLDLPRLRLRSAVQAAEIKRMSTQLRGISHCAWLGLGETTAAAYVHVGGRAHWGPARGTIDEALRDRKALQEAASRDIESGSTSEESTAVGGFLAAALRAAREVSGGGGGGGGGGSGGGGASAAPAAAAPAVETESVMEELFGGNAGGGGDDDDGEW